MSGSECPPVVVEGDWSPAQTKTVKNKLLLHFQSKKKSNGADCRVEVEDGAPRAAVYFRAPEVKERVLKKESHEIVVANQSMKLRLISPTKPTNKDDVSDLNSQKSEVDPENGAEAANEEDSVQSVAVVLENVPDVPDVSRDVLMMLVENTLGLDERDYTLEIIWESNTAVVTFSKPEDVERFLTESQVCMKKHGLTARPLEATTSVQVEILSTTVVKELLELYFEKSWARPENVMIPDEHSAIVTFSDPKVVKSICIKQDHIIGSIPVKVYPYYESLGTALYGKERPAWKMPKPFTEHIDHAVWKYLLMKKELRSINDQMRPYFCSVELCEDDSDVKLSPLPSLLRQKDLTAKDIDNWRSTAQEAFHQQMSQYSGFQCPANASAWKAAETDVRSIVRQDAVLLLDEFSGTLTVAGRAVDIKQIRALVENIVLKAMSQTEQEKTSISESSANDNIPDSDSIQSVPVLLENVPDDMSRDVLMMLLENISGSDENSYSLEIIWEFNRAVVTFNKPGDVERFLTGSQTSTKMQKYGLTARLLEAATSVRVENLPPSAVKELLELYFDKNWAVPDKIIMIPDEQAAIATFNDPKVVKSISINQDHVIGSIPVKLYPYYKSLGTALYGKERPAWKLPESFTEHIDHAVWRFLQMRKELKSINDQMRSYFCCVDLCVNNPRVKLSPLPSLLRQKDLTAKDIDNWMSNAKSAFHQQMSQYSAFECPINTPSWKAAETDVRSFVKEDVFLELAASMDTLTVSGRADDIKQIRAPVENIVLQAMSLSERQTNGVSDEMDLSFAMFYILNQDGLQKVTQDISPQMNVSYNEGTHKLTIIGLPAEVYQIKSWILERQVRISRKQINFPQYLFDFLKSLDPVDMSQDLFASQGISAFYAIENEGVFLMGSTDSILCDAERKLESVFSVQTLDLEGREVLNLHNWFDLNKQLLDTYNSSKKKTVAIQIHPGRDKITVVGFVNPVKEVNHSLKKFMVNYSQVQESICLKSCAVVQFINKNKLNDWKSIAEANNVKVSFDSKRPRISISGAPHNVQRAKSCSRGLISSSSYFTDTFTVDKPGAKKYFMSQGSMFLSTIMTESSCVVVMCPNNQEEEEETGQRNIQQDVQVFNKPLVPQSSSQSKQSPVSVGAVSPRPLGVYQMQIGQITLEVSSGDITKEASDVIVNSSNPDFNLKAGVSKKILDCAGSVVEQECAQIVNSLGYQPRPMIITSAGKLPSEYIIHVVGQNDPAIIKDTVYSVLNVCEENKFSSVSFPALETGQGGAHPTAVADAMIEAVVDFVKKTQPKSVHSVKILIFQTAMMMEFHRSMMSRQAWEGVEDFLIKIKDFLFMGLTGRRHYSALEKEKFEPAVFDLCAENDQDVRRAKKRIIDRIVAEQAKKTMRDPFIKQLSQADMEQLKQLQRELTVTIHLDKGRGGQEPSIHLEGLTRDVFTAEAAIRDIIRKVARS
ncbi:protein mono-ADP-ribosyltransferase PARP14-like [Anabas testudineus]|uniref:protein mono-ADP-ribosyltransferase PARP14-like n=1 Tax=Anabas testudineus TaxID=64144 RepID=UPI000E457F77|nr:protein mono-ADP-ribosyltransferase PARP14-like [Anabas testudineus]XP_026198212.1 protein mono-ADP-ribosyltransferase PARP14-like [Anabas testudineus]